VTTSAKVDRAALVRRAIVELVAERGIHGTSMSQVAQRAGVATGTAYVHYESKEELLIAAFVEIKSQLGLVATHDLDPSGQPRETFATLWRRIHDHVRSDIALARFLSQIDESPLRKRAHEALPDDDPLTNFAAGMMHHLVDLPLDIVYELGVAPAIRLAASDAQLDPDEVDRVIEACWRAISI